MSDNTLAPGEVLRARIVAAAIAACPLIYAVVVVALDLAGSMPEDGFVGLGPSLAQLLGLLFLAMAVVFAVGSFPIRAFLVAHEPAGAGIPARIRSMLVAMAVCEAGAVLGLVHAMLAGLTLHAWLLWAVSIAGCILLFPTRAWLERPAGK